MWTYFVLKSALSTLAVSGNNYTEVYPPVILMNGWIEIILTASYFPYFFE